MTTLERAAQAFERSMAAQAGTSLGHFVGTLPDGYDLTSVTIDGEFNLLTAMRAALAIIREPTDEMCVSAEEAVPALACFLERDRSPSCIAWRAMIDAILEEKSEG